MSTISLLGLPFLVALEMIAILGYVGIHVLKREIIFVDIALAQVAAVGAIVAHLAFEVHGDSVTGYSFAFGATLLAAGFYSFVRRQTIRIPLEAVIGVTYAVAAALALFLVGVAPGGHVHIHQMLAGSILWTTPKDVILCGGVFAATGLCFYLFRKPLAGISDDYEGAVRKGTNTIAWDFVFYTLVGIIITLAVRIAGVVIVFTFLIIPATLSAIFAKSWGMRLVIAWITGGTATGLGLLFANAFDFSVGPAIALFLGLALVLTALLRQIRITKTITAVISFAVAGVLFVWFLSLSGSSGPPALSSQSTPEHSPVPVVRHEAGAEGLEKFDPSQISVVTDPGKLKQIFDGSNDMEVRTAVVSRFLEIDPPGGIRLALEFLKTDPPLLFRQGVINKLQDVSGLASDYNIEEPFNSPDNQRAIAAMSRQ